MTKKKLEESASIVVECCPEETITFDAVHEILKDICSFVGVQGYIIKDEDTATINLEDSEKTVPYAMLVSQAFELAKELSQVSCLGEGDTLLLDCADLKVLCVKVNDVTVSIFMEKNVDHTKILNKLLSYTERLQF
ncbi:MAG: hypothetical protein N3D85_01260 [Candidatus Bathyarchaeota archaeon]|nr:hypothetical protein [Candidatus Bathyarchaeota archaeon]